MDEWEERRANEDQVIKKYMKSKKKIDFKVQKRYRVDDQFLEDERRNAELMRNALGNALLNKKFKI